MRTVRLPTNHFHFGEISPDTVMRVDTAIYQASASSLKNFIIRPEGGVVKRPGSQFIHDLGVAPNSAKRTQVRLLPFQFSEDEKYIIAVTNAQLEVFRVQPVSYTISSPSNIRESNVTSIQTLTQDVDTNALPFDDDYLHEYTYAQYGDVMIICHPLFQPRLIRRTGLTTFQVELFTFDQRADGNAIYQPYSRFANIDVTLAASATTGSGVTLTTSADYFESGHVGTYLRYGETEIEITGYTNATTATGTISGTLELRLSILNPIRTRKGSAVVEVTHLNHGFAGGESITFQNSGDVGGILNTNINGARTVGNIIDEDTYEVTMGAAATVSEDGGGQITLVTSAATRDWAEQALSDLRGWPGAITFHENRLVFGGSTSEPDTLWFSASAQYFNFDTGDALPADAINLVASTGQVNTIRYLVSNRDLQVFTAHGEFYVPSFLNQALTPTNAQIRRQTALGCEFAQPQVLDSATLYVQHGGRIVREYLFTDAEDAYISTSVSSTASHLINDVKEMAVGNGLFGFSDSYAFLTKTDGTIALFSSNRVESRAGWTRWELANGAFESVVSVDDRLFCAATFNDLNNQNFMLCEFNFESRLDCGEYVRGNIDSHWRIESGLWDDGDTVPFVVYGQDSGTAPEFSDRRYRYGTREAYTYLSDLYISWSSQMGVGEATPPNSFAQLGIAFESELITNPIDAALRDGPATGMMRGIHKVAVQLRDHHGIYVNGDYVQLAGYSDSVYPATYKLEAYLLGYELDPRVTITEDPNFPTGGQIDGLITEVTI